jgi:Fe-S cluster assembly ATP-binding protein
LVITHYQRLLNHLKPDRVLVLKDGRLVDQGGEALVKKLERQGYKAYD